MNGTEIISFLASNFPTVMNAVSAVTGGLFTAIFLKHNTAVSEFEKIKAGKFKEVADDLLSSGKMTFTEYYKANNFLEVAKKADEYYSKNSSENESESYNFDWFVRFFEAVGNISDEKMQELWAKILAGEISKPKSYSLKTIDVLRNIDKQDAELFVKICSCSFPMEEKRVFLPNDVVYLRNHNIQYADIMRLSEYGLIFNNGRISYNKNIDRNPSLLFLNRELVMIISSYSGRKEEISIDQFPFTVVGSELFFIINESGTNDDFIEYGRLLAQSVNCNLAVHRILKETNESVQFDTINLLL